MTRTAFRLSATISTVAFGFLVLGAGPPAEAQMEGGGRLTVVVKPHGGAPRATAGSPIRLLGSFDKDGRPVEIRWGGKDGEVLATVALDRIGEFRRTVVVPEDTPVGTHLITATQKRIDDTEVTPGQVSIDVVATDAEATVATGIAEPVAVRGRPSWVLPILIAVDASLVAGLLLVRRRRRARSTAG